MSYVDLHVTLTRVKTGSCPEVFETFEDTKTCVYLLLFRAHVTLLFFLRRQKEK